MKIASVVLVVASLAPSGCNPLRAEVAHTSEYAAASRLPDKKTQSVESRIAPPPVLIGDSVLFQNRAVFDLAIVNAHNGRSAYANGYGDAENYVPGWGDEGTGAEAVTELAPDVATGGWLVVELGVNDLHRDPNLYVGFIHDVEALLPDGRCLGWVLPYNPDYSQEALAFERVIRAEIAIEPCNVVIDWPSVVRANSTITVDGVHPTPAGALLLAALIEESIGQPVHQSAADS